MSRTICAVILSVLLLSACAPVAPSAVVPVDTVAPTVAPAIEPTVAPTNSPEPTIAPTPEPTIAPTIEAPADVFESGAFGLDKSEFEKTRTQTGDDIMGPIYDDELIVMFDADNKIWYIEQQFSTESAITPEDIEVISGNLLPADAELVETYSPAGRPETTVNLYMSESLKSRFDDTWTGGEPGNFTVHYNVSDGVVTRMIIAPGNNP